MNADLQKLNRLAVQMREMLNHARDGGQTHFTSLEREKYNRLETEYTEISERLEIESGQPRVALKRLASGAQISDVDLGEIRDSFRISDTERRRRSQANDPHARAFSALLREGERLYGENREILNGVMGNAPTEFKNAMSTIVGTQGGDLVPQGFSDQLEIAKKWWGGIENTVGEFSTGTGNTMPWPTINDTSNKGRIIGQNQPMSETDLVFNTVSFTAYIASSDLVLIPLALVQDSYFDLDALAAELLGIRLGRLFNSKCTVGTGMNEPTGIITAVANGGAGNILTLSAGNAASIAYNNLVDLQHAVDPAYRENPSSKWMFSDTMLKLLKKLVDGNNRPLWQPGLTASFQEGAAVMTEGSHPKILGNGYVINQDMPIPAANAYSVLFGDMSTFKVRKVAGGTTVLVLRDRYAEYLQVGYTAFQRFDSNAVNAGTNPLAVMQQSAT